MNKKLSEMSIEELWQLFPVVLTEHRDCWADWYDEEAELIKSVLPTCEVHHVGSTAIDGIMAKPIVDILAVVESVDLLRRASSVLQNCGYMVMSSSDNRISLNKGYTESGYSERVFHVHVRLQGDADEIYFRDYLNAHPAVAREYERLKLSLSKVYKHDRDAYTAAKTEFVKKYTDLAKASV